VASMTNHVAGAVKDKLLKELEGRTGETDSEDDDEVPSRLEVQAEENEEGYMN
jgi:hypothetical protein